MKEKILATLKNNEELLDRFLDNVKSFFFNNKTLNNGVLPSVHSIKYRKKDFEHLMEKIERKNSESLIIDENNLLEKVNDLIGVRVLYLHKDQFEDIHKEILKNVDVIQDWKFVEPPVAYTWDPEYKKNYENLGIRTELKPSSYTSVHYVVKPNNNSNISCEIQVRTLFEEIWGEIDHSMNYPQKINDVACREQLMVLSKLVCAGTRLTDSIFRSYGEHINNERRKDDML